MFSRVLLYALMYFLSLVAGLAILFSANVCSSLAVKQDF